MKSRNSLAILTIIGVVIFVLSDTNKAAAKNVQQHKPGNPSAQTEHPGNGFGHYSSSKSEHPIFGNMSSAKKFTPQVRHLAGALDLTADQVSKIQAIITAQNINAKTLKEEISADYSDISAAVLLLSYDTATITALANQLGEDVANLAISEAKAENDIYVLLTSDQQALFVKVRRLFSSMFD